VLKQEIEDKIRDMEPVTGDTRGILGVSEINFIFENADVISMLLHRGETLECNHGNKAEKIENQIKDYLRKNWSKVSTPREAYVTFKTEEAYLRAIKLDDDEICGVVTAKEAWKGEPFVLEKAQEPSNIYWENRFASSIWKAIKLIIVTLILVLILFFFALILFCIEKLHGKIERVYPEIHCHDIVSEYKDHDMLKNFAMTEWFHWQDNDGSEESILKLTTTNIQCYCEELAEHEGRSEAMDLILKVEIDGKEHSGYLCRKFLHDTRILSILTISIPFLIYISDLIIKHACIVLSRHIGFDMKANEIYFIQVLCFNF
jgi:hypothetical protein